MSTIPTLTEQDIGTFVGEQNFLKGQQLVRDGAIVNPEQQGMTLKAYCYGDDPIIKLLVVISQKFDLFMRS